MKLTTNEIRDALLSEPAIKMYLDSKAKMHTAILGTKVTTYNSKVSEVNKAMHEAQLHLLAEMLYILQWKQDFSLAETIKHISTFDASYL